MTILISCPECSKICSRHETTLLPLKLAHGSALPLEWRSHVALWPSPASSNTALPHRHSYHSHPSVPQTLAFPVCWGSLASLLALPPPTQSQPSLPLTASLLFKHPFCRESSPAAQSGLPYFLTPVCSSKYLPQVSSQHCAHLELVTICFMHLPQCTALSPTRAKPISILFTTILLYITFPGSRNTDHKNQ